MRYISIGSTVPNDNLENIVITVNYTDSEVSGLDEASLTIYYWDGSDWQSIETTVDTANNYAETETITTSARFR